MKFENEKGEIMQEREIVNLFNYETLLKETILKNGIGQNALKLLKENTLKKVYVVPSTN